jgi:predicted homoserine dehydrogenase-like protein
VLEAPTDYAAACFRQYGMRTDASGRYAALYRPYHLIGLELNVSILAAGLLGQATGATEAFRADVVAVAKRDLAEGETLDGEGGATVWGALRPAAASVALGALPIGLAQGVRLTRAVSAGEIVRYADVALDETDPLVRLRRAMRPDA